MRAFTDSRRIVLRRLSGGLSAHTFLSKRTTDFLGSGAATHAVLRETRWPATIARELFNYEAYATQHIPWNLRPNVDYQALPHWGRAWNSGG